MKIHEYNEMMSYLTRPAVNRTGFNQGTKKVASLMDEYLGDQKEYQRAVDEGFQGTYEEFLRMRSMRETSARGGVIGEGGMFQGQDMGYRTGFNRVEHAKYKKITKLTPANLANFKYPKDHKYKVQVPTRTDLGPGSLQTISAKTKKELKEKVDNSPNTSKDRLKIFKKSDLPEGAVSHDATRYKMRTGEYTGKGRNKSQIFSLHYKGNPDGFVRYFTSPGKRLFDSIEEVKAGKRKNSQDMSRPLKIKTQRIAENIVKNTYEIPGTEEIYEKFKPFIGKDKITIAGEGVDTLEEAQKFVDDYFKKNPKIIRVRDPKKDWASKDKRLTALAETEPTKAKGTATHNFHHIRQIAGGVPLTSDDVLIIDQRINSSLGTKYDKPLNAIADAIRKNNRLALEAMNAQEESLALEYMKRSDDLNAQAEKLVNSAIDKLPKKYKGYVGFNQFTLPRNEYGFPISNEPMIIKKVGGLPISKDAIDLTDLNLKQEAEFRKIVRQQAEAGKTGPINKKEINRIFKNVGINLTDDLKAKAQNFLRSALNKGQDITKYLPFKTLRKPGMAGVAALDYGLFHYLFDVPSATAALGASGWLTKSRPISDTILAQTQTMSFMDEMNQKKEEEERIENALAAHRLKKSRETARDIKPFQLDFSLPEEFAGGGRAGLSGSSTSGRPPESGPQSGGLPSLYNNVRKW